MNWAAYIRWLVECQRFRIWYRPGPMGCSAASSFGRTHAKGEEKAYCFSGVDLRLKTFGNRTLRNPRLRIASQ